MLDDGLIYSFGRDKRMRPIMVMDIAKMVV
jgi:hypothetical protein